MAQAALRHLLLGVAASGLLMGCVAGTGGSGAGGTEAAAGSAASAPRGAAREVEAPEVFQTTDSALWDGRPSLGGIWVASPDAVDPERVVMFNPATGKSVTGALFRRERDNPGPALQVSSDAAEALGMLAGQPTELQVTALRREEPVAEAAAAPEIAAETPAEAEALPETSAAPPEQSEAEALAAAALSATGATTDAAADTADAATDAADAAVDPAAATEEPKRKTWKERRAEAKAQREAERAAKAAAEAAAAGEAVPDGTDPVDPTAGAVAEVETAPLDARDADAAAAPPDAAPPDASAATGAEPGQARTIQIASFSKEENANRAVEALAKIGITAQAQKSDRNGTAFWGVIASGDAALLARIRDAGFADAFFLQ
jgi:hypothetical protein